MMSAPKLSALVADLIRINRERAAKDQEFADKRKLLFLEAKERKAEFVKTDGGGFSWTAVSEDGSIARITFPARKLKGSISEGSDAFEDIEKLVSDLSVLFDEGTTYKPCANFRELAVKVLGDTNGKKLIKLCESKSEPTLSFEVKEPTP